jgi:hypothetical protein
MGSWRSAVVSALVAVAVGVAPAVSAQPVPAAKIRATVVELADAVDRVLLDDRGAARGDYHWQRGVWEPYEVAWHTGQAIEALLAAHAVSGERRFLERARQAGEFWIGLRFATGPLKGMINAAHGDHLGALINFTTVGNGTAGLFRLSRVTSDRRFADVASEAIAWQHRHMAVPGRTDLSYNIVEPDTGRVWTDRSPHHDAIPATLTQVARPNIEGSPFLDACRDGRKRELCAAHRLLAEGTLARQGEHGLWMEFEPNDPLTGVVHPRFNTWNAEAMLRAYREYGERRFLDAALRTARANARMMRPDGSFDYRQSISGEGGRDQPTGSATAFAGLLWLDLRRDGVRKFDEQIHAAARWLIANRYPADHPDPNLRGLVVERRVKRTEGSPAILQRDLGNLFAVRFFEAYLREFGQ